MYVATHLRKIHYDHAHEQSNKTKSSSGTIDLVNRVDEEVQRWEIAGPGVSKYLENVEEHLHSSKNAPEDHHEDSVADKRFCDDYMIIKSRLMHTNPFEAAAFVIVGTHSTFHKAGVC